MDDSPRQVVEPADERTSGVLCHPTSLPTGRLGDDALRFIDWLATAGQRWWQVLPLGPPDAHGSPYDSSSAFAGSPLLLERPGALVTTSELETFVAEHSYWSAGWARFGGRGALEDQVRFEKEWDRVHRHANERGIRILGDVPFYVARDGADHLDHRGLFDERRSAGVPPDDWSRDGQLWGNPIYDWPAMRRDHFCWWIERFRRARQLVDSIRIDHFRGFVAYWSVPRDSLSARVGTWRRSPGLELFQAVHDALGELPVVAENLGVITPAVEKLRNRLGFPGTVVLQFEFNDSMLYRATRSRTTDNVVYTGTHDNDTSLGWWHKASAVEQMAVDRALRRLGVEEPSSAWKLLHIAMHHPAQRAIVPMQDVLSLDSGARMNHPGMIDGNWRWQFGPSVLTTELARRLRAAAEGGDRALAAT